MTLLFLLSLLAFFFLGWAITRRAGVSDSIWVLIPLAGILGTAFLEIILGIAGRWFPWELAFLAGGAFCLITASLLTGLPSRRPPVSFSFRLSFGNILLFILILGSTFLVAKMSLRFSINDEIGMQGHQSVVESILRGVFPPKFISFPELPYRYHYGFNLLAAAFSRALGLPGYLGIDVTAVLLWVFMLGVLAVFLDALGVPRRWLALALGFVVLAGGWSWWLARHEPGGYGASYQAPHWQLMYIRRRFIQPSFAVYFFQHPMSLGIPFLVAALIYFDRWNREKRPLLLALSALFLGALSLAQVMLFATALAAFALVFFLNFFNSQIGKKQNLAAGVFFGLSSLALAFALGGFFSASSGLDPQPLKFSWPPGYLRNEYWGRSRPIGSAGALIWYFSSFGWMLLLYPYALYRSFRSRRPVIWFLSAMSALGFLIPQFFQYRYTWDIIKWFVAFEIFGRLLIAWAYSLWLEKRRVVQAAAWVIVLSSSITPVRYLWDYAMRDFSSFSGGERRYVLGIQPKVSPHWNKLFENMRGCGDCRGTVWTATGSSAAWIASQTGFPGLILDYNTTHMGISAKLLEKRKVDLKLLESTPNWALLQDLDVKWIIFSCTDFQKLPQAVQTWFLGLKAHPGVTDLSHLEPGPDCFRVYFLSDVEKSSPAERPEESGGTK